MKITVTQRALHRALSGASRVAQQRTQLPILNNILLRTDGTQLQVAATNLELAVDFRVGAKVDKQGSITVPAKLVSEFISQLPDEPVRLEVDANKLHIHSGNYRSTVNGIAADEFPELPSLEPGSVKVPVQADTFKQAVSQVIGAASADTTRPILTGIYIHTHKGQLYLVGTDGYRLAERKLSANTGDINAITPTPTLQEILRLIDEKTGDITLYFSDTSLQAEFEDVTVTSRLIDGSYPDYRQLIPASSDTSISLPKEDLLRVVKIASLFARDSGGGITLESSKDNKKVSIHSITSEVGENTSEADLTEVTNDGSITLNSRYLLEALANIDSKKVSFRFSGSGAPSVLTPEKGDILYVIMPLKS